MQQSLWQTDDDQADTAEVGGFIGPPLLCRVGYCTEPATGRGWNSRKYRWCKRHEWACHVEGCGQPRRVKQGAKFCVAHSTSIKGEKAGANCVICDRQISKHSRYINNPMVDWDVCGRCSGGRAGFLKQARRHHASAQWVHQWVSDPSCYFCHRPVYIGKHYSNRAGSQQAASWNIDHDHGCCEGLLSCGECIRGLACNKCNTMEGYVNKACDEWGPARVHMLVDMYELMREDT